LEKGPITTIEKKVLNLQKGQAKVIMRKERQTLKTKKKPNKEDRKILISKAHNMELPPPQEY